MAQAESSHELRGADPGKVVSPAGADGHVDAPDLDTAELEALAEEEAES